MNQPVDCFIIVTGQVKIIDPSGDEERILLEYSPGNFTGEMAILTQRPSTSSCHAITHCETVRLTAAEMRLLMVKCPRGQLRRSGGDVSLWVLLQSNSGGSECRPA